VLQLPFSSPILEVCASGSQSPAGAARQTPDHESPNGIGGILFPVACGMRSTGKKQGHAIGRYGNTGV